MLLKNVTEKQIFPGVVHLQFPTQELMASTFLRPQEYYESPHFKDKVFSLEEFKKWYIAEKGVFSYAGDWPGFNIPSSALRPFYEGKFDPLSEEEKELLDILREYKEPFYVIGTSPENGAEYIDHEIAHALYYTNRDYHEKVSEIIYGMPKEDFKEVSDMINIGYHESVIPDEVQAHLIANFDELVGGGLDSKKYGLIQKKLTKIFNHYSKR